MNNILLIRPRPPKETIGLQYVMICEPLELEYMASNISSNDINVEIIDMIIEKKPIEFFLKKYNPFIVGITGYITHVNIMKEYCKRVKMYNKNCITVVGGVHCEVVPEDFVDCNIDYILESNGIDTFNEIIKRKKENRLYGHIKGTYKEGEIQEKKTSFTYRFPDRKKVEKYRKKYYYMFHNPCTLMKTSFGCPYKCNFCFCKEITAGKYFARTVDSVIDELLSIPEKDVYIVDDDFLFNLSRLNEFCDKLEKNNIKKQFLVYGRADFIANNEKMIERLSNNGLKAVIVGLESARQNDLDVFNKKVDVNSNEKAVNILQKYGIEVYATLVLHIDFDKQDFYNLKKWIKKMNLHFVNLQPLTPLPKTDLYDLYKDKLIIQRKEHEKWDLAHLTVKPTKLSIREYYFQILKLYFEIVLNPKTTLYMIKKYGLFPVIKLGISSQAVSFQYIKKIIRG